MVLQISNHFHTSIDLVVENVLRQFGIGKLVKPCDEQLNNEYHIWFNIEVQSFILTNQELPDSQTNYKLDVLCG